MNEKQDRRCTFRSAASAMIVAALVVVAACGSSKSSTTATSSPLGAAATTAGATTSASSGTTASSAASGAASIEIKSFKFSPNQLSVKAGTTITVTNNDSTNHTLTADDKSFDTGRFASGSKTITVANAGTVAYHCEIHASMTGVIEVSA